MKRIVASLVVAILLLFSSAPVQADIVPTKAGPPIPQLISARDHKTYTIFQIFDEVDKYSNIPLEYAVNRNPYFRYYYSARVYYRGGDCYPYQVEIGWGLLSSLKYKEELLFVLLHEITHVNLGHLFLDSSIQEINHCKEMRADAYAVATMIAAGYSPKYAVGCLANLHVDNSATHPGAWKRILSINKVIRDMNEIIKR